MSEKKFSPAGSGIRLLASVVGILVLAGCLAEMAALMVSRELSGSAAAPLATAAAGISSFCSGWIAAFQKRERGLLCGAVQGLILSALLLILALPAGLPVENTVLLRAAAAIFCGCFGGFLGVRIPGRKPIR